MKQYPDIEMSLETDHMHMIPDSCAVKQEPDQENAVESGCVVHVDFHVKQEADTEASDADDISTVEDDNEGKLGPDIALQYKSVFC